MGDSSLSFKDYKSCHSRVKVLKTPICRANEIGIVPDIVYKKYFSFDI